MSTTEYLPYDRETVPIAVKTFINNQCPRLRCLMIKRIKIFFQAYPKIRRYPCSDYYAVRNWDGTISIETRSRLLGTTQTGAVSLFRHNHDGI